jgi:hypothetical protein
MQCRICFEEERPEDMITPCRCAGSIAFIHRRCLLLEQQHRREEWERTGRLVCTVCRYPYEQRYLRDHSPKFVPDLVASSCAELFIACVFTGLQIDANVHEKLTVLSCLFLNIVLFLLWVKLPLRYSIAQHLLIHATTFTLVFRQMVGDYPWERFVWVVVCWAILFYAAMVVRRAREEDVDYLCYYCVSVLVLVEYILIIVAFQQTVENVSLTILFTTSFTNLCLWGYSAIQVYGRPL